MEEHFWSLAIEDGWIQAAIWTIREASANVVIVSPTTHWETDEDLISAADSVLSSAVQTLPENTPEPSKTVFGVPPSWVSEGQIKKEYLDKIKIICNKLSLEPAGFVVLPEAIAHYKKSQDNAPVSAVIIGIGKEVADITLFRLGNMIGTVNVGRSVSIVDDVIEGLARFVSPEPFPSQFLLYDGKSGELDDIKQELIKADWMGKEKIKFLHTPQVETIDPKAKMVAVSLAGASEIGHAAVATFSVNEEAKENNTPRPDNFGFVVDQDIKDLPHSSQASTEIENVQNPIHTGVKRGINPNALIAKIRGIFMGLPFLVKGKGVKGIGKRFGLFVPIALAILIVLGLVGWWFLPKADIAIFVSPKKLEEKTTITFSASATSPDLAQKIIPAKITTTQVKGEKTRSTTGTKTIGEKAKGKVTIRNGTSNSIGLSAGTALLGPNNLKFTLDTAASVSAAVSPASPGTGSVAVTAESIGAEYNLAKGETLKVGNFSKNEVDGLIESDLSGGSAREIVAVGKEDMDTLEEDLTDELLREAKNQISQDLSEGEMLVEGTAVAIQSAKNFNHKVGDEASTLKLNLTLDVSAVVVVKKDLDELTREIVKNKVPSGFVLRDDQISIEFDSTADTTKNTWKVGTTFVVNLLPQIDPTEVARKISGKYPKVAQNYFATIAGFERVEIRLRPALPFFFGVLPHQPGNINVEISANK